MTEPVLSIMIVKDGHRMKLYEGNIGATYLVESVHVDDAINRRLEALGVNENTRLLVMNKKKSGTMIIKVRGTRLALGRRITGGIDIKEEAVSFTWIPSSSMDNPGPYSVI